jgi:asparagine synthase (glutamine-hydrolysing)
MALAIGRVFTKLTHRPMCGIAGLLAPFPADRLRAGAIALADAQRHRGPDGAGVHVQGPVALAHRRLSIIDLEAGAQPLANEDGSVWITFNGEIYNYRELRVTLEQRGHRFRTHSDTEVIVHAYEEWGDECVKQFRGMFAFAIADARRQRVKRLELRRARNRRVPRAAVHPRAALRLPRGAEAAACTRHERRL